jgi:hypothetical protein
LHHRVVHGFVQPAHRHDELREAQASEQGRHAAARQRGGVGLERELVGANPPALARECYELRVRERTVPRHHQAPAASRLDGAQRRQELFDRRRLLRTPSRGAEAVLQRARKDGEFGLVHRGLYNRLQTMVNGLMQRRDYAFSRSRSLP